MRDFDATMIGCPNWKGDRVLSLLFILAIAWAITTRATYGRTTNARVVVQVDNTDAAAPIEATGEIIFQRELLPGAVTTRWEINLRVTNLSSQPILAYEAVVDAMPDIGGGFSHVLQRDYFFDRELAFYPGSQINIKYPPAAKEKVQVRDAAAPRRPYANFRVLFVEFADGTTVGHSNWARALRGQRVQELDLLRSFLAAYGRGGDAAVATSVRDADQPRGPNSIFQVIDRIKFAIDSKGVAAVVPEITEDVNTAEQRKNMM